MDIKKKRKDKEKMMFHDLPNRKNNHSLGFAKRKQARFYSNRFLYNTSQYSCKFLSRLPLCHRSINLVPSEY